MFLILCNPFIRLHHSVFLTLFLQGFELFFQDGVLLRLRLEQLRFHLALVFQVICRNTNALVRALSLWSCTLRTKISEVRTLFCLDPVSHSAFVSANFSAKSSSVFRFSWRSLTSLLKCLFCCSKSRAWDLAWRHSCSNWKNCSCSISTGEFPCLEWSSPPPQTWFRREVR